MKERPPSVEEEVVDGGDEHNFCTSTHSWSGNRRFTIQLGYSQAGLLESETYVSGKGRASCLGEATRDRMMEDVEACAQALVLARVFFQFSGSN